MRKYINKTITVLCVTVIGLGFVGCDQGQTVSDPISTDTYPIATFETDFQGDAVTEGDTIQYTVRLDRMSEFSFTFEGRITGGTADASDVTFQTATIPAYSDSATFSIIISADDIPEEDETISFEILDEDIVTRYELNPETEFPSFDNLTINNHNDPDALTIAMGWEDHDTDMDLWLNLVDDGAYAGLGYDGDGDGLIYWDNAATADNPEIMKIPSNEVSSGAAPTGEYYVEVDPYAVATNPVNYRFLIGHPDQTVEFIDGTFDNTNLGSFTADSMNTNYDASNDFEVYRMLEVSLTAGGDFTVTDVTP